MNTSGNLWARFCLLLARFCLHFLIDLVSYFSTVKDEERGRFRDFFPFLSISNSERDRRVILLPKKMCTILSTPCTILSALLNSITVRIQYIMPEERIGCGVLRTRTVKHLDYHSSSTDTFTSQNTLRKGTIGLPVDVITKRLQCRARTLSNN